LKDENEEENNTIYLCEANDSVDYIALNFDHTQPEQENGNTGFQKHTGEDIERLACPPVFKCYWEIIRRDSRRMLSSAIMDSHDREDAVSREEDLSNESVGIFTIVTTVRLT
jgi:hypothetical protein